MKKRRGPEALAIYEANYKVSKVGEYFIYAVFVLGLALVGMSDKVWKFSQTWVWLAIVLYLIALGLSHGVLFPAVKRMGVLMRRDGRGRAARHAGPAAAGRRDGSAGQAGRGDRRHPRTSWSSSSSCLMVFKPGACTATASEPQTRRTMRRCTWRRSTTRSCAS